jgi:hypothetical protein
MQDSFSLNPKGKDKAPGETHYSRQNSMPSLRHILFQLAALEHQGKHRERRQAVTPTLLKLNLSDSDAGSFCSVRRILCLASHSSYAFPFQQHIE